MPEERQKSIVAAILAVHSGIVSPDEAVAMLKEPGKASSLAPFGDDPNPMVTLSSGEGEFVELPIIDVLDDPEKQRKALKDIGIEDDAQQTLFNFGAKGGDDMKVIADTLNKVGRRNGDSGGEADVKATVEMPAGSETPTQAPKENTGALRLTTSKFFANYGFDEERYEIRKEHARGGMGRIMIARDKAIGREIALKELLPGMTGNSSIPGSVPHTTGSHGIIERFLREAKITGQLEHPNIVPVYEIGKHEDDSIYYTMRFVRGQTLSDRLRDIRKDATLSKEEKLAARIKLLDPFIDVCHAIAYAHNKGVIHRDIKPENIMLGEFGETQVLDWGLARIKGQEDKALKDLQKGSLALSKSLLDSDSQALTLDGSIVGTPAYMPPEQARGEIENVDEQSDIYSLGAVLYQILTGHAPYEGPMAALIVQQVLNGPPMRVRSREKDVPPELEALVGRAMARDKNERIRGALELASEVKAFRDGRTLGSYSYSAMELFRRYIKQHRTAVSIAVLGVLLLVAGTIFFMQRLTTERNQAMQARDDAETQQELTAGALALANQEREERERLEKQSREQAQREMDLRVGEARKLLDTIAGMRVEPALDDLAGRLAHYEVMLEGPPRKNFLELPVGEQVGNGVLLSSVLGYISAKQNLVDLLTVPEGVTLPEDLAKVDLESHRLDLVRLRLDTARLATINGDFPLAMLLLSDGDVPDDLQAAAVEGIESARAELLALHRRRINEALADVERGLEREERGEDAPNLDEYARRLSTYRERQTVELLRTELERLMGRGVETWKRNQFDMSVLICRVLGNCEQPGDAIPVLVGFLEWTERPELIHEASLALCATGSMDAFQPLIEQLDSRGLDYWDEIEEEFADIPMPARVRDPQTARDFIDRSIALRARGKDFDAEIAASRALNVDERSTTAKLHRALANARLGNFTDALRDLDNAIDASEGGARYELLLARGNLRDSVREHEAVVADFTSAIELAPRNYRAYMHRAGALADYYRYDQAFADYDKAIELAPHRIKLYLDYGRALATTGRVNTQRAYEQFTKAIDMWPQDWRGWSARAVLSREHGTGSAYGDAKVAVKLNPKDSASWSVITQVDYAFSRFHEGIQSATRAVEANPDEWLAYYYRGLHYHQMQTRSDGQQYAAQVGEAQTPIQNFRELRTGNLEAAADSFYSALKVEPTDFRTSMLLIDTLMQLGRFEDARAVAADALELSPFCYMRWGGMPVPSVRFTHDALKHLELLNAQAGNFTDRIRKVALLSIVTGANEYNVFPGETEPRLREAVGLMEECWNHVRDGDATPDEIALFCYAQDRLIPALMSGHGRTYYVEASVQCERRVELGRYLDADFYFNQMKAHLGLARGYREKTHGVLGRDSEDRAARKAVISAMPETQRFELDGRHMELAGQAFEMAVERGFSEWPWLWARSVLGDIRQWGRYEEVSERMAEPATVEAESLYDDIMLIVHVLEGGPAWQAGIRKFDNIARVNETPVATTEEFFQTWTGVGEGEEVTLTVRRYITRDGHLMLKRDGDGQVIRDEAGFADWDYEEFEVKIERGFLGVNLGGGFMPPRFER